MPSTVHSLLPAPPTVETKSSGVPRPPADVQPSFKTALRDARQKAPAAKPATSPDKNPATPAKRDNKAKPAGKNPSPPAEDKPDPVDSAGVSESAAKTDGNIPADPAVSAPSHDPAVVVEKPAHEPPKLVRPHVEAPVGQPSSLPAAAQPATAQPATPPAIKPAGPAQHDGQSQALSARPATEVPQTPAPPAADGSPSADSSIQLPADGAAAASAPAALSKSAPQKGKPGQPADSSADPNSVSAQAAQHASPLSSTASAAAPAADDGDSLPPVASIDATSSKPATTSMKATDSKLPEGGSFAPTLGSSARPGAAPGSAAAEPTAVPPETQFAGANHVKILTSIRGQLLPDGGSLQLRLDPPELGAMQVTVHMRDGQMTAAFETSNDQATRLLSHSLGQLKTMLESHGVTVDALQVKQAPKTPSGPSSQEQGRQGSNDASAQQEQQRKEMLRRLWRRLSGGKDPLDLVA